MHYIIMCIGTCKYYVSRDPYPMCIHVYMHFISL